MVHYTLSTMLTANMKSNSLYQVTFGNVQPTKLKNYHFQREIVEYE